MTARVFIALAGLSVFLGAHAHAADGEKLFKSVCSRCHSLEPGNHKFGPSLAGVIGRKAGSLDFNGYRALKGADWVWDEAKIEAWLADPKAFVGKPTPMTIKVLKKEHRMAIVDYLKSRMK